MTRGLTYERYLRLPLLLDQQHREGPPGARDEMLFITVHQVHELWFKLLLHELADARDLLLAGETRLPLRRLHRCQEIQRLLVQQVGLLDTMTQQGFAEFRAALGSASGGQSMQFMEIQILSGLNEPQSALRLNRLAPQDADRLPRRRREPSLWDGYLAALAGAQFDVSTREGRRTAYAQIACGDHHNGTLWTLHELTEALVEHDQAWSIWRARHALAAERQIGAGRGTGGTPGGSYLWSRVPIRFYPELWEARGVPHQAPAAGSESPTVPTWRQGARS
jgi:tryptophan 2,3-dioxygenase